MCVHVCVRVCVVCVCDVCVGGAMCVCECVVGACMCVVCVCGVGVCHITTVHRATDRSHPCYINFLTPGQQILP